MGPARQALLAQNVSPRRGRGGNGALSGSSPADACPLARNLTAALPSLLSGVMAASKAQVAATQGEEGGEGSRSRAGSVSYGGEYRGPEVQVLCLLLPPTGSAGDGQAAPGRLPALEPPGLWGAQDGTQRDAVRSESASWWGLSGKGRANGLKWLSPERSLSVWSSRFKLPALHSLSAGYESSQVRACVVVTPGLAVFP